MDAGSGKTVELTLANPLGLHARPASILAELSEHYRAKLVLRRQDDGREADCRSVLELLMMEVTPGVKVVLEADGDDADEAISEIIGHFQNNFGE